MAQFGGQNDLNLTFLPPPQSCCDQSIKSGTSKSQRKENFVKKLQAGVFNWFDANRWPWLLTTTSFTCLHCRTDMIYQMKIFFLHNLGKNVSFRCACIATYFGLKTRTFFMLIWGLIGRIQGLTGMIWSLRGLMKIERADFAQGS